MVDELKEKKEKISALVGNWHSKTKLRYAAVIKRMSTKLGENYSSDRFEHLWRRIYTPGQAHFYERPEVFALIASFSDGVPENKRINHQEIFDLLELTGISKQYWGEIKHIFPETYDTELDQWFLRTGNSQYQHPLAKYIRSFKPYIEEKLAGFVGREWVLQELDAFLAGDSQGYFLIMGEPGIGKSSIAAHLVAKRNYLHHFNIRRHNVVKQEDLLENLCAQLIIRHGLPYYEFPASYKINNLFFVQLLEEVSKKLEKGQSCVILIDAVDEAEESLILPPQLPRGIYIILIQRPPANIVAAQLILDPRSDENREDVAAYIQDRLQQAEIHHFIEEAYYLRERLAWDEIREVLLEKSEGNFIYLHYVFLAIEQKRYVDRSLKSLPQGLAAYYNEHWELMKGKDKLDWHQYKLPILVVLAVIYEPIPMQLIIKFAKIERPSIVYDVIQEWRAFLYEILECFEGENCYRIYHESFFDFLLDKDQITAERVQIKKMRQQIDDTTYQNLGAGEAFPMDPADNPY